MLKPVPTGQPVATKGFGGAEQVTSAPSKPVQLPAWAAAELAQLKVPADYIKVSDMRLANGIRLIVKTDRTTPTVSVLGAVKHDFGLQTPAGQEGISDVLSALFSYGSETLDRLAFRKALDDIAANETAGYEFSLSVLTADFSSGVELLADNELHPALPEKAFAVVKRQTSEFVAGNLKSPEYRTLRALDMALLPAGDPVLRQATPATVANVTLERVRSFYAATVRPDLTTIVVIGDVSAEEAKSVVEKWFGGWHASAPKPDTTPAPVPRNKPSSVSVADPQAVQDSVFLAEQLNLDRFYPDYYPLELGNHVLGGGFYATRLYHDLRQVAGYVYTVDVRLDASKTRASYAVTYGCEPDERIEGPGADRARSRPDAHARRVRRGTASGEGIDPQADRAERVERGSRGARLAGTSRDRSAAGRAHHCVQEVLLDHRAGDSRGVRKACTHRRPGAGSARSDTALTPPPGALAQALIFACTVDGRRTGARTTVGPGAGANL